MHWNTWIRQAHRWVSMLFTLIVTAIFVALGIGQEPAQWVYFLPLAPLAFLTFSGLYMFILPYVTKTRARRLSRKQI